MVFIQLLIYETLVIPFKFEKECLWAQYLQGKLLVMNVLVNMNSVYYWSAFPYIVDSWYVIKFS